MSGAAATLALRRPHVLLGIGLAVAASAFFAALDTSTKYVSVAVPLFMTLWFRYFFQAVATTLIAIPMRGRRAWVTRRPAWHAVRGLLMLASGALAFASLRFLPVGEFTALIMITPLVITLLAATWLKEHVSSLRWALVAGGFIGTLIIIRPGAGHFGWSSLLPLALVACNAAFQVLTSKMAQTEDPVTMHLYSGWAGAILASLPLPLAWAALPDPSLWIALLLVGIASTVGHFLLILAYTRAPASTVTPYLYCQIAFAMLAGLLVFSHVPDRVSLAGMALIAFCGAAGAWLTVRERRNGAAGSA